MSAHVPAWKRLGLKLKGPASDEALPSSGRSNASAGAKPSSQVPSAQQARLNGSPASALKRKLPSSASTPNASSAQTPSKKPRRDQETPSSLRKSVSFANDTKDAGKDKAAEKKKPKKKKAKKAADAPNPDVNLEPSLNYLRQWHTARESWKFNKNHQTLLIKYLFDGDKIPSADIPVFYQYIRDLKGFVRTRLRETAAEIKKQDMEAGTGAFPATLKDKETKQKEYEETISRFLQDLQQHQQQQQPPQQQTASSKNANGKRTLEEVEYVLRIASPAVKQRLLKRIRAEMVLGELSDSEDSTATAATTTTASTSSSSASSGQEAVPAATTARQSDGSQQPAKRRRLRNVRTDIGDDDDSSSSSESDSSESAESSSSSSESDDSSDDDEDEMDTTPEGGAAVGASSSSSSSSSSSESSESESDSDESEPGSGSSDED